MTDPQSAVRSPQSAVRSPQSARARACLIAASVVVTGSAAFAQGLPPQARYSTHDNTQPVPANPPATEIPTNFQEWMVDTKTPGNGFVYSVGTITVNRTDSIPAPQQFSGAAAIPPVPPGFSLGGAGALIQRQVGILQVVSAVDQVIQNQSYFYGSSLTDSERATNLRGISVWPAADAADTRIAICGESYDETLPECDSATGWTGASATNSGGFIAVYDGNASLLWTWHFFGGNAGSSAVTDVSIRVDANNDEYVTYCGISSHGNPAANGTLDDLAPFVSPGIGRAAGDTDNGAGQWDGFVGRIVRPFNGAATKRFHAVVGGVDQDGLFGLAEIDTNRFAVVGSTGVAAGAGAGTPAFPLQSVALGGTLGNWSIGVALVFDASTVSGGTPTLTLESDQTLGNFIDGANSVARDIVVQPEFFSGFPMAAIVGSTDDTAFLTPLSASASLGPQSMHGGAVDGFVVVDLVTPGSLTASEATFRGGDGVEILTGVNAWSEFTDYFVVTGSTGTGAGRDIDVASYLIDTDSGSWVGTPMNALTSVVLGGTSDDHPTAIGAINATTLGLFDDYGIGDPQGGGVAVDETARVNVVGTTDSAGYDVSPAGPINFVFAAGRPKTDLAGAAQTFDGTRTVLDLLPAVAIAPLVATPGAVGRTDGTGQLPTGDSTPPPGNVVYPLVGWFGGTTPECSLLPFGYQIGVTPPAGYTKRMLIGCEQVPAGGQPLTLFVSRQLSLGLSAWQIDFPGIAPNPPAYLPGGAVAWITGPSVTFAHLSVDATERFTLTLPSGAGTLSVQLIVLPTTPVGGSAGGGPGPCTTTSDYVATPALWLSY